jgi:division protein CdvB (Snf7/Vps24/ESCRT-III family)
MLKVKDEEILHKLMTSIKDNNIQYSTMLSTELAKEMKVSRVVLVSKITLEMLSAKLSSASDFRDLVIILSPIMAVVKNLRSSLTPLVPEMEDELGIVAEILSGILVDAGQVGGYTINFETANEEAVQLIDEASRVAEEKMNTEFPEIPDLPIVPSKIA